MSISVLYQDIALKARENTDFQANLNQDFAKTNDLISPFESEKYGTFENEGYPLDGTFANFPDDAENYKWGYFGNELSQLDGTLSTHVVLVATISNGYYSSTGISLKFDTILNNYPAELKIKWYKDANIIANKTFNPDSSEYFCSNTVKLFNKVEITFTKMNKENIYLKITDFEFGTLRTFTENELTYIDLDMSIAPISEELSINTLNFGIENKQNIKFNFQDRQGMKVLSNKELLGTFYITKSKQKSLRQFEINTEDMVGALDGNIFYGGIYNNISAKDLIAKIMLNTEFEYTLEESLKSILISGYLPIMTTREALTEVAFAIGATISTAYSSKLNIFTIKPTLKAIKKNQIFYGGDIETTKIITEAQMIEHGYVEGNEEIEVFNDILEVGPHEIQFGEPLYNLTITNATITIKGSNYAIINVSTKNKVSLKGKNYIHTTKILSKKNTDVLSTTPQNIVKVKDATLITQNNSTKILDLVYNKYVSNRTLSQKVIINDEKLGDKITTYAEFGNQISGVMKSMEIDGKGTLTADITIDLE